jgi:glutathione reductase (NADPH)
MSYDYDLFVIGAGSGGVRASRMAAGHGARVAVAEDLYLGGTCVNVGCVPKKLFVYASHFAHEFQDAAGFGWQVDPPSFDWATLLANKNREIERLNGIYKRIMDNAGVEIINGRATIVDPHTVDVAGAQYTAERILVATGGWPTVPEFPGSEHVITSNEAFYLDELPDRIIIVGGGYIAVEFAGIFNGLGVDVHQLYRGDLFLRGFDEDIRRVLAEEMQKAGVNLHFNTNITAIDKDDDGLVATLTTGETMAADCIMYATGRTPKTAGLGLENTAVQVSPKGAVIVNDDFQTAEPSIYAIGDVIDRVHLTPVALAEGMILAADLYGPGGREMSYDNIPTAVFSQPNIGTVGPTEAQALAENRTLRVYTSHFRAMKHTLSGRDEKTFMKLIVDAESDRVIGVHMVGPDAGEILRGIGIAVNCGATKADFDRTIGIHPTAAEEFVTMRTPRAD